MLASAGSLAAAGALADAVPSAFAAAPPLSIANDDQLERALPALSNWGRWGQGDQIGTLNFMTPETRLAAAALIRTGRVVPFAREMSSTTPNLRDVTYKMKKYFDPLPEEAGCIDEIGMTYQTEPMHMVLIPYLGMPILDNTDLDRLAAACAEEERWALFVSVAPWRFKGATSSPVNPLAIF